MQSELSKLKQAWNDRLYKDLQEPLNRKHRKQAHKARKQARYRKDQLASLHAISSKPFIPRVIRRVSKLASMANQTSKLEPASKLDTQST